MANENKLLLVDGHSIIFRAFYALHSQLESMKNHNGLHTNALYGFHNMLENIMEELKPTHVLVAFDAGSTTFRHDFYDGYKGGRDTMPTEMSEQLPYLLDMLDGFGVRYYELDNYEADDIIGTLSHEADQRKMETIVLTGDRDLTQLASAHTSIYYTKRGVTDVDILTPESTEEEFGITPDQVTDYLGLKGDPSDNIPGVTGIGEKTATKLLNEYGSIEGIYENIDEMNQTKRKENLMAEKDIARLSKQLATIDTDSPVTISIDDLKYEGKDLQKLIEFYKEMDFNSHLNKLDTAGAYEDEEKKEIVYEVVDEIKEDMFEDKQAVFTELLHEDYHQEEIAGIAWGNENGIYITSPESAFASEHFLDWVSNKSLEKTTFDAKATLVSLYRQGEAELEGVTFDILLASYLLTAKDNHKSVSDVCYEHNYNDILPDETIYGKGAKISLPDDPEKMYEHLAKKIKAIYSLTDQLREELKSNDQENLLMEMELPLSKVLAVMEMRGITVDRENLENLREEFDIILSEVEKNIYEKAGEEFNINSPKQLSVILFEKMGYPVIRKTKTGYSTAQDVLEKLQPQAPIVDDILRYRQINKIQSTYVEGLLKDIDETGRVHTRFLQTVARTGRLSSVDPNLQNIPIRTEEGRKIRKAFTANHEGWKIFASDYSQIELRVMAHISGDEHLKQAFIDKEDIHTTTAVRIFDLEDKSEVSPNMRRDAKAINFGIIYGMSDYGLSESLGITRKEAKAYIETYFDRYPGVKNYIDTIIRGARDQGYVETIFNRRRYLPEINSRNYNQRSFAERTAMNTPIQGSAADIIKMAMIKMEERLREEKLETNMLLQVHDELIFETPPEEIEILSELVKDVMENVVELSVPLTVESSYGDNWHDADE